MAEKKKLNHFLSELLKVGCVKGFRYFATHLRGREEIICSIINEPTIPILLSASNSPASSFGRYGQEPLPKDSTSLMMSRNQQRRLSGYGFINVGLPPASPSETEQDVEEDYTMFLIAGYARYDCPYVWIRSNHDRLVRFSSEDTSEKDFPLQLKTTSAWKDRNIPPWDIIAELVTICTTPSPPNPFAVDFDYFDSLPLPEKFLASGAMVSFLKKVLVSRNHSYDKRVCNDLQHISEIHFRALNSLMKEGQLSSVPTPSQHPRVPVEQIHPQSPLRKPHPTY